MNTSIFKVLKNLLLEQKSVISDIRKAITEKLPLSIYYSGPPEEVKSGQRLDILPIVLGNHISSGNLVIWAFVWKGVSKKGLPNWKMFRVDRIKSAKINPRLTSFNLEDIPQYVKGKAPSMMKSLGNVMLYSPYVDTKAAPSFQQKPEEPVQPTVAPPQAPIQPEMLPPQAPPPPEETPPQEPNIQPEPGPAELPKLTQVDPNIYNSIKTKIRDFNGQRVLSSADYESAVQDLYRQKEGQWKNYQRMVSANTRTGQGTRQKFMGMAKKELDNLLLKDRVTISDETQENLAEVLKRFKALIS